MCLSHISVEPNNESLTLDGQYDNWAEKGLEKQVFLGSFKRHPPSGSPLWSLVKLLQEP